VALRVVEQQPSGSEADLIAGCIRGDRACERELFRREYTHVHALVFRLLGSARELDDLAQEVFIAVFHSLPRFRGEAKLRTWIDRIAVHVVIDHIAAKKRVPIPVESIYDRPDPAGTSDDRAQAREGLRRLYAVLATLAPDARIAFALYSIDGRSIREVAEITRVTTVTAKLRIWRARRDILRRVETDPILSDYITQHRGER
jgi:RNA polymerase sigma-70 factor (ECF subfamily)